MPARGSMPQLKRPFPTTEPDRQQRTPNNAAGARSLIGLSSMAKLFVDKTVEIDALPFKVWDVLTKPEYTAQWAPEFERGAPFRIESDWHIGAPVLWKDEDNQTVIQGKVTRLEPEKLLRFTVSD